MFNNSGAQPWFPIDSNEIYSAAAEIACGWPSDVINR